MRQFQEAVRQGSFYKHSSLDFIQGEGVGSVLITTPAAGAYSFSRKGRTLVLHLLIYIPGWEFIFSAATMPWLPALHPTTLPNHVLRTQFHKTALKPSSEIQFCVNAYVMVMPVHEKRVSTVNNALSSKLSVEESGRGWQKSWMKRSYVNWMVGRWKVYIWRTTIKNEQIHRENGF